MTKLNCSNCDFLISNSENLTIYLQTLTSSHLTVKLEKRNQILDRISINEETNDKKKKFIKSIINCKGCNAKIGSDTFSGPNSEAIFCFKGCIYHMVKLLFFPKSFQNFIVNFNWILCS